MESQEQLLTPREYEILTGINAGFNMPAVAILIGISRERVRQILENLGERGLTPPAYKDTQCLHTVARKSKLRAGNIRKACDAGLIRHYKLLGLNGTYNYRIPNVEIGSIPLAIELLKEKRCAVCDKFFLPKYKEKSCPGKCRRKYYRDLNNKKRKTVPTESSCRSFIVMTNLPSPEGEWILSSEACEMSQLSRTQIENLINRGSLPTKNHPTKKWRGEPMRTVNIAQIRFVGKVFLGTAPMDKHK